MVIDEGVYASQQEDIKTVSMWNFVVANKNMPDELAYEITRTVLERNDSMIETHRAAVESLAENMVHNAILPVHPGAQRYYQEMDIDLPTIGSEE